MMKSLPGALLPYLTVLLSLLGLTSLVVAAFLAGVIIGFVALGVAFLLLAFYAESEAAP
jgi:hypothetical protein